MELESYIMLKDNIDLERDESHDLTLIVRRAKLRFNDSDCVVLNFQDITTQRKLKHQEEKGRLMSTLYSSVHHEMLGPLKASSEAAVRLIRGLQDPNFKRRRFRLLDIIRHGKVMMVGACGLRMKDGRMHYQVQILWLELEAPD